jgi:hypothetical protein
MELAPVSRTPLHTWHIYIYLVARTSLTIHFLTEHSQQRGERLNADSEQR